ncbi:hypothetical protein MN0502_34000 (plasmid) [Arthrobacter sp. MN05-02]|nr:hypothetical protein MN0502_34000 [Arthrobacter sp. MN05-02]
MGALVWVGLLFLTMGISSALLTCRADRRRIQLMNEISPNNGHPGVIMYAKVSRTLYIAFCLVAGTVCTIIGIVNLIR